MTKRIIVTVYIVCALVSWTLMQGWEYADVHAQFPHQTSQEDAEDRGFCAAHSALAVVWPISLPLVFCITGFGHSGWHPIWKPYSTTQEEK